MLYWKKNINNSYGGFYEENIEGSTPVTEEKRDELIKGQEEGYEIIDDGNGNPILTKPLDLIDQKRTKERKVKEIKQQLNLSDYKVIKCYEASLSNEQMPYNLQELLGQRKTWREEINALEFEISMLE
jgi:hypothetical protein